MADEKGTQAGGRLLHDLRRQWIPVRRLYRLGRLDPLFLLPLFLWFSLWAAGEGLTIMAMAIMLVWSVSLMLYHVAVYQLLVAGVGLALLVFVVIRWPVWIGAILVVLYVIWLRRAALGKRHAPRRIGLP